jgi:hypothetical protein
MIFFSAMCWRVGLERASPKPILLLRDISSVWVILLISVLGTASYFGIRFGANRRGIILGFGLDIGVTLMTSSLMSYSNLPIRSALGYLMSVASLMASVIWLRSTWSYHPDPLGSEEAFRNACQGDVGSRTRQMMESISAFVAGAVEL